MSVWCWVGYLLWTSDASLYQFFSFSAQILFKYFYICPLTCISTTYVSFQLMEAVKWWLKYLERKWNSWIIFNNCSFNKLFSLEFLQVCALEVSLFLLDYIAFQFLLNHMEILLSKLSFKLLNCIIEIKTLSSNESLHCIWIIFLSIGSYRIYFRNYPGLVQGELCWKRNGSWYILLSNV